MENIEKLKSAFIESLNIEASQLKENLEYGSNNWDSVAHMALITAIENEFDIMLDTEDVIDMSSFKKAKEIVAKYGVAL
jgi:acyl carrier protein